MTLLKNAEDQGRGNRGRVLKGIKPRTPREFSKMPALCVEKKEDSTLFVKWVSLLGRCRTARESATSPNKKQGGTKHFLKAIPGAAHGSLKKEGVKYQGDGGRGEKFAF